ncbi:hypothetical protein [Proteiniborus sp. MB09-C3]|uniref:hypothetical protein n=1 Tax=Proteiniborus sp. MB09-C3 TaxID=3050072 RepID=UPI002552FB55|nr:hypothetical protein [Proteiniborus sp. MB09-C3]WIV13705.1 hypothetical protein QO263_08425 [Proteiniborus sp. MB09-C3]
MRIILNEFKKIWNIKLLLVAIIIGALFYMIFMADFIEGFKRNHSSIEEAEYAMKMTRSYGAMITDKQLFEFMKKEREALISEAEGYINTFPIFSEVGIYKFKDYEDTYSKEDVTEREYEAIWTLLREKGNFVRFKLQALDVLEERYYNYPKYTLERALNSQDTPKRESVRLQEIKEKEEYRNIMDGYSLENTVSYSIYLAILTVLTVLVLVSPLIANDRSININLLQYSSNNGRRILLQQFISIIISAFMVTTLCVLIFGAIYTKNGTFVFWNNGLTSFLNFRADFFWFDLSYGQYIILYILLLYTLAIGSAALAFVVSRFSQNLIAVIMKLIPIFGIIAFTSFAVFLYTFSDKNFFYKFTGIPWLEPIACGIILLAGLTLSMYILHREKEIDVL